MEDFDGFSTPERIRIEYCPFWAQIHGLPLGMMNEKIAMAVGSSIEKVLEAENEGDSSLWGRCLRVRVNVNIHNALK